MSTKISVEIASFLDSFTSLIDLSSKGSLNLSLDDIYYLEYCKVKAEQFIHEITYDKPIDDTQKAELDLYVSNLKIIKKQIEMIEKTLDLSGEGINFDSVNKIDNNVNDYEYTVRKPGNLIYSEPFSTDIRDIVRIYSIAGSLLLGVYISAGMHLSDWSSIGSTVKTYGIVAVLHATIMATAAGFISRRTGKFNFKRNYVSKQRFASNILMKILTQTNKKEYMYLLTNLSRMEINKDNVLKVYYTLAKIELIGEYMNKHYEDEENELKIIGS